MASIAEGPPTWINRGVEGGERKGVKAATINNISHSFFVASDIIVYLQIVLGTLHGRPYPVNSTKFWDISRQFWNNTLFIDNNTVLQPAEKLRGITL